MKLRLAPAAALLAALALLSGCVEAPPDVTVTAGGVALAVAASPGGAQPFQVLAQGRAFEDIPYLPLGEEVRLQWRGGPPDAAVLRDSVLYRDGTVRYTERETETIPLDLRGETASFPLGMHMAALLSSNSADYAPGETLRGFRLTCTWGDAEREYVFLLRSDAGFLESRK